MATEELAIVVRMRDFATAGLKKAGQAVKELGSVAATAFKGLSVGALGAGLAGGGGLIALLKDAADRADGLNDLARQLGVSVEALGALQFAAQQSGVSIEELEGGLKTLGKGLSELDKTGPVAAAFSKLSTGLREAVNQGAPLEDVFVQIVREMENLSAADRAIVSNNLFGKAGSRILRLVGEDVDGLAARFRELGGVIDQDLAQKGDALNDSLGELRTAATGLANDIAKALLPEATKLAKLLTDQLVGKKPEVLGFLADLVEGFGLFTRLIGESAIGLEQNFSAISGAINQVSRAALVAKRTFLEVSAIAEANVFKLPGMAIEIRGVADEIKALDDAGKNSGKVQDAIRAGVGSVAAAATIAAGRLREAAAAQREAGEAAEFMGPQLEDVFEVYGPYIEATAEARAANQEAARAVQETTVALADQAKTIESADFIAGTGAAFREAGEEAAAFGDIAKRSVLSIRDAIADSISNELTNLINVTKSAKEALRDLARSILSEIQKIIIKQLVLLAVNKAVGGIGGLISSAKGNVFQGGNVIPFARGGLISQPVSFPLAGGKTGIAGEAGTEAIVPLKRNSRGQLGVVSSGATAPAININVTFVSKALSTDEEKRMLVQNGETIAGVVASKLIQDSTFREAMRPAA